MTGAILPAASRSAPKPDSPPAKVDVVKATGLWNPRLSASSVVKLEIVWRAHYLLFWMLGRRLMIAACAAVALHLHQSLAEDLTVGTISLPALRINGQPARAHTQGLEIISSNYFVTARQDDVLPKRALLLRTDAHRTDWDVWDITPTDARGDLTPLNHPGGMQSDGTRLWIPLAESKRNGSSLIRAYPMGGMVAGKPLNAEVEFPVNDHVGALAVSADRKIVYGANWDTEAVYVWDFDGRLQRTLKGSEMEGRRLGIVSGVNGRAGLAVQDWKMIGDRLFASGLFRGDGVAPELPQSRLMIFTSFSEPEFQRSSISLPKQGKTELAQEAMAIADGLVYFLPEDLGASNRIFRVSLADLMKRSVLQDSRAPQKR